MSALMQFCALIVTTAFVAIAVAAVRMMFRVERLADELSRTMVTVHASLDKLQIAAVEVHELLVAVRPLTPALGRVVSRFEELGSRAANLSDSVLHEIEAPIRSAVAVARGVRLGTSFFLDRLTQRFAQSSSATNGGSGHE